MDAHLAVIVEAVRELMAAGEVGTAVAAVDTLHPSDLATVLAALDGEERTRLILSLDAGVVARAVWELEDPERAETVRMLSDDVVAALAAALPDDGAADLVQELPADRRAQVLAALPRGHVAALQELLGHAEETAGGLMTTSFVAVASGTRVDEVFDVLRAHRDTAFVYYVYVLDAQGHPVGVTSLRELIVADPSSAVDALMRSDPVSVGPGEDQEEVARLASRYDLLAVPVVSSDGRMLGIVTADDVLEVLASEAEEDVERFVGSFETEPGRRTILAVVRARTPWVLGTFAVELAVAYAFLRPLPAPRLAALIAFLPLLLFTGGNAAIAAAGGVVHRLRSGAAGRGVVTREVQGAALLAMLGAVCTGGVLFLAGVDARLAGAVSASVGLTVLLSSVVGSLAPLVLGGVGRDPALASGPLLGALADVAALAVYLIAARAFL